MTPAIIIKQAQAEGVSLTVSPAGTIKATGEEGAVAKWLPTIRSHKAELLDELRAANSPGFNPAETYRQRVLAMLDQTPTARYKAVTDEASDPGHILLWLAIRGKGSCCLKIPCEKWDGVAFLELLDRNVGTLH